MKFIFSLRPYGYELPIIRATVEARDLPSALRNLERGRATYKVVGENIAVRDWKITTKSRKDESK